MLQHWQGTPYRAWKADRVAAALDGAPVSGPAPAAPGSRRRIDLAIRRAGSRVIIGLHRRRSAELVDMHACTILAPKLLLVVAALRNVLPRLSGLRRGGSAIINQLDSGPDVLLRMDGPLSAADRVQLSAFAASSDVPRVSWAFGPHGEPETACQHAPATTHLGGVATAIPPGAFLQATRAGESAIQEAVMASLPTRLKARPHVIELFAGCGTLSHHLSTRCRVTAYEGNGEAVSALRRAGNPRITPIQRDLFRQPLSAAELRGADAIVLDPPFAGASVQIAALAESGKPVVYVSCNPQALARDVGLLSAAGYRVTSAVCVDQFLWSPDVEAVVGLSRATV